MKFALNHITTPKLSLSAFFALAREFGMTDVEIRNDLPDIVGSMKPEEVKLSAEKVGVNLVSINALYPFNVWSGDVPERAEALADYAHASGAKGLVMCPLNDGTKVEFADLVLALQNMKPILEARQLVGFVEPLGFPISSLRTKAEAIDAIKAADGQGVYQLVHDTFHHHLASEKAYFPEWTGLVHISGVVDPDIAVDDMLDAHRVLVDDDDRLQNIAQIKQLLALGYDGPFSFEPFAKEVHDDAELAAKIAVSMDYVSAHI